MVPSAAGTIEILPLFEEDSRQIRIPKKDFVSTVNTTAEFVLIVNFVI